jgi:hypothetical protein
MPKNRNIVIRAFISVTATVVLILGVAQVSTGVAQASTIKAAVFTPVRARAIPQVKSTVWVATEPNFLDGAICDEYGEDYVEEGEAIAWYCEENADECPVTWTLWILVEPGAPVMVVTLRALGPERTHPWRV